VEPTKSLNSEGFWWLGEGSVARFDFQRVSLSPFEGLRREKM
jgi:hypothetical protein